MDAMPSDPAQAQIIPVPPRPFPAELRDSDLLPVPWRRSAYAVALWMLLLLLGGAALFTWAWPHFQPGAGSARTAVPYASTSVTPGATSFASYRMPMIALAPAADACSSKSS
jgi:hypothetical protein